MPKQWFEQWDRERVQSLIDSQQPEDVRLEFKRADVLNDDSGVGLTKAVSGMANADGGVVIFGVATSTNPNDKKDYPFKWDPIIDPKRTAIWLDQKLDAIRPKVRRHIETIPLDDMNGRAFVVSVRKGSTVHQASDKKYYQRTGERTLPMEDYQIRDVMNRVKHPRLQLQFTFICDLTVPSERLSPREINKRLNFEPSRLEIRVKNIGPVLAQFVQISLVVPLMIITTELSKSPGSYDKIDTRWTPMNMPYTWTNHQIKASDSLSKEGFFPILPQTTHFVKKIQLDGYFDRPVNHELFIGWKIYADNARPRIGKTAISDIKVETFRD